MAKKSKPSPVDKTNALELLKVKPFSEVRLATGISETTLRTWASAVGVKPPDGRRKSTPPPAATSPRKDEPRAVKNPHLQLLGLSSWIEKITLAEVRATMPGIIAPIVREELQRALSKLGQS